MEGDECTSPVRGRELIPIIKQQVIGRPMPWKGRDRRSLFSTCADSFSAVAPVFRGKDKLLLAQIKVTIRPPVIGAALELHQLLRRLVGTMLRLIELWPVFPQLVAAVLGRKYPTRGVE